MSQANSDFLHQHPVLPEDLDAAVTAVAGVEKAVVCEAYAVDVVELLDAGLAGGRPFAPQWRLQAPVSASMTSHVPHHSKSGATIWCSRVSSVMGPTCSVHPRGSLMAVSISICI